MRRTRFATIVALSMLVLVGCESEMESDYTSGSQRSIDTDIRATRLDNPTALRSLDRRDEVRRGTPGF